MCTGQKESPKLNCQVEYFGLDYSGILLAKLLLRSPGVSKNEQTALLSLEKDLLWKQQEGAKMGGWGERVIGSLVGSKLSYVIEIRDDERVSPTKAREPSILMGVRTVEGTESGQWG